MDILNITNVNYELIIQKVIKEVNDEYRDLTKIQTCIIYSSMIYEKLQKNHIICRMVNTKDLGIDYEHVFVLVKGNDKNYIIDLTFNQFFDNVPSSFESLSFFGYQLVSKDELNEYLALFNINLENKSDEILFF